MRSDFPFLTIPSVSFPVRGQTVNKCAKRGKERRCETISRSTFKHNFHTLQIMSIGVRMHLDFNYTVNSAGEKKGLHIWMWGTQNSIICTSGEASSIQIHTQITTTWVKEVGALKIFGSTRVFHSLITKIYTPLPSSHKCITKASLCAHQLILLTTVNPPQPISLQNSSFSSSYRANQMMRF